MGRILCPVLNRGVPVTARGCGRDKSLPYEWLLCPAQTWGACIVGDDDCIVPRG